MTVEQRISALETQVQELVEDMQPQRPPDPIAASGSGGGGGECSPQNAILDYTIFGSPTGGTFSVEQTINAVTETLTFGWNFTAAQVQTEYETHSQVAVGDVSVSNGPFPNATVRVEFIGNLENTDIEIPVTDFALLTGGSGVGVIVALAQLGTAPV